MKAALIILPGNEENTVPVAPLKLLGYIPVVTNKVSTVKNFFKYTGFEVVVIHEPTLPGDRRSLAGEIKRAQPNSIVVLVAGSDDIYSKARSCHYSGLTAVLREPITYRDMWRIVEYERDGFGCHPGWKHPSEERRRAPPFSADH